MDHEQWPRIIQGGMGVGISSWQLARAVALTGELGVVSGTALEVLCARRLQAGDPDGHVRRALAHFPVPELAERVLAAYFVPGGKPHDQPFRNVPMYSVRPARALQELTVVANFVEVFLAKEGHDRPIGINYLRKIELPIPFACYGALLAGVDYVLVGAGNPAELPGLLDRLAAHDDAALGVKVQGLSSSDGDVEVVCRPRELVGSGLPPLRRPRFLAIVASVDLAAGLASSAVHRPDGFIVEGPTAGGHNAPPRGPRRVDEHGQPIYDHRDHVDLAELRSLGLPFWLAGSYGTPEGLQEAEAAGAAGIQVGTAFAVSAESGMEDELKHRIIEGVADGDARVLTDWRASPTGFPFKVVQLKGTLSDDEVYADRRRVCDLGVLRSPYKTDDGTIGYRCPAEPEGVYAGRKGGRAQNTEGRTCLCNALFATAGYPQRRSDGYVEPPLVTSGTAFDTVAQLSAGLAPGQLYRAADVVSHLREGSPAARWPSERPA